MSKFEWHTEDDWPDDLEEKSAETPTHKRALFLLGFIALLAIVGAIVFTQLQQTVNEATGQIEEDVQATFGLLHDSAENGDIELFSTYLSGRDRDWTMGYQILSGNGSLIERDALRLDLVSDRPEINEIVLEADLRSAVLTATTDYAIPIGNGLTQTVTLEQPYHFRQGETRWLFAPPEDDFWGETQTSTSDRLLYSYPTRDEEIVLRLMRDVDTAYGNLCNREPELVCPNQWAIRFEPSALRLAELRDKPVQITTREVVLPTPTLVGLPTNQDSYRALLSGYAHLIFTDILAESVRYSCCAKEPLFSALVDQISAELGLRANLDAPEHFDLAAQYLTPNEWPFDWNATFADSEVSRKVNYTTVTFLRQQYPSVSAFEMLMLLSRNDDRTVWIQQIVARIDSTANNINNQMIWRENYLAYENWLRQRLDSYAVIDG